METGVVWSGAVNYNANGQVVDVIEDNYSSIGGLDIGCVGASADVWFTDCTTSFFGTITGEVHLPELAVTQRLQVRGALADQLNGCVCRTGIGSIPPDNCGYLVIGDPEEESPRGIRAQAGEPADGIALRSAIRILEPAGLHGQIILNSDLGITPIEDAWRGDVVVGEGAHVPQTPIVLSPLSSSPHLAPYYEAPSALLGGGAVGLVPFRIHEADCEPPHLVRQNPSNPQLSLNNALPQSAFANASVAPCKVRFYGPIRITSGTDTSVIDCSSESALEVCGRSWQAAGSLFTVSGPASGAAGIATRTMSIARNPSAPTVHVGKYRVGIDPRHGLGIAPAGTLATYWRVCAGVLDEAASEAYFFRIANGATVNCHACPADFNCSGMISVQDIFDFLGAYFTDADCNQHDNTPGDVSPCYLGGDINNNGTKTVQDLFDFLGHWFGGC